MEDKKRLVFSFFELFFFALKHTPMESAVDEVRSCRCTFGSRQMGGRAREINDVMYRQNTRRPQS